MKYVWMAIRLLLPIAMITLAVLSIMAEETVRTPLLSGMLLCLSLNTCINLYFQQKGKKAKE